MRSPHVLVTLFGAAWCLFLIDAAEAQPWGTVAGTVTESSSGTVLPGITIVVHGTNFGTASQNNGRYELSLPAGRYVLRFSAIGYAPRLDSITVRTDQTTRLDVTLQPARIELEGVTVESETAFQEAGIYKLNGREAQRIPSPLRDGLRALKTVPGVASNNELSSQYSVRGGGYNENLIFINGFEVYTPFRLRKGEHEGLGLVNIDMADQLTLYTGGFPVRYGGKLSSALEVRYGHDADDPPRTIAYLSLLDAGVSNSTSALNGRLRWSLGVRKARPGHLLETQQTEGIYEPDFTDGQGVLVFQMTPTQEIEALGLWTRNRFGLTPTGRQTYYFLGSVLSADYVYRGEESSGYDIRFGGLRLRSTLSARLKAEHAISIFDTRETEALDILGLGSISDVFQDSTGRYFKQVTDVFSQWDQANNRIHVQTWSAQGRWMLQHGRNASEAGWKVHRLQFDDTIQEASFRNYVPSLVFPESLNVHVNPLDHLDPLSFGRPDSIVVRQYAGHEQLNTTQFGVYLQQARDVLPERDRLLITAGLRTDYFAFNDEWTVSPRLSLRYRPSEVWVLNGAWGLYHQQPTYRELRGEPAPGESILDALNHDLKSQRSMQVVLGGEYFHEPTRQYWRAAVYYKRLTNVISYDAERVRLSYSGENDARGKAYGVDLQWHGEFLPGLESRVSYSFLVAREALLPEFQTPSHEGWRPRPMDQRHTASMFIQDYFPGHPDWKLHFRLLYGTGFPYTPQVFEIQPDGTTVQVPQQRHAERYAAYLRIDTGFRKSFDLAERSFVSDLPVTLQLSAELLNIFDVVHTISYDWVPTSGTLAAYIPTRLTPRTFNLSARLDF